MNNSDLFKLALGGLAAGFCLLGRADALSKCSKTPPPPNPPQTEEGESHCGGGPTCASCTVPSDCSDVSDCNEAEAPASLRLKRQQAAKDQTPEEA